jgi:hypothetical protein
MNFDDFECVACREQIQRNDPWGNRHAGRRLGPGLSDILVSDSCDFLFPAREWSLHYRSDTSSSVCPTGDGRRTISSRVDSCIHGCAWKTPNYVSVKLLARFDIRDRPLPTNLIGEAATNI